MKVTCKKRGFFPHGGGEILLQTQPIGTTNETNEEKSSKEKIKVLPAFQLVERGEVKEVRGISLVSKLSIGAATEIAQGAQKYLSQHLGQKVKIHIDTSKEDTYSFASAIVLIAETTTGMLFGSSALGDKKENKSNAQIGETAAQELIEDLLMNGDNSCVDRYLQDQLILFAALAKGKSVIKCGPLELHTKTAIHFAEIMTGCKYQVTEYKNMKNEKDEVMDCKTLITCEGVGLTNIF